MSGNDNLVNKNIRLEKSNVFLQCMCYFSSSASQAGRYGTDKVKHTGDNPNDLDWKTEISTKHQTYKDDAADRKENKSSCSEQRLK